MHRIIRIEKLPKKMVSYIQLIKTFEHVLHFSVLYLFLVILCSKKAEKTRCLWIAFRDALDVHDFLLLLSSKCDFVQNLSQRKNTTVDMRQLVIFQRGKGETYREIGAALRVIPSTVADIIRRFHSENCVGSIAQTGAPSLSSTREKNRIIRKVKENPQISVLKIVSY